MINSFLCDLKKISALFHSVVKETYTDIIFGITIFECVIL